MVKVHTCLHFYPQNCISLLTSQEHFNVHDSEETKGGKKLRYFMVQCSVCKTYLIVCASQSYTIQMQCLLNGHNLYIFERRKQKTLKIFNYITDFILFKLSEVFNRLL